MAEPLARAHPEVLADAVAWGRFPWEDGRSWMFAANALDVARSTALYAAAGDDHERLAEAAAWFASMVAPRTTYLHPEEYEEVMHTEGFQVDMGFNQHPKHGRQPYLGAYGLSFLEQSLNLAGELASTRHRLPPEDIAWLQRYFEASVAWMLYRGRVDPAQLGRVVLRPDDGRGPDADPARGLTRVAARAEQMMLRLAGMEGVDADALRRLAATLSNDRVGDEVSGHRHFWRFDHAVHRRPGFFVSFRMSSTNTIANEAGNGEGVENEHTGSGWNTILREGDEADGLLETQDWERLPGTTTRVSGEPLPVRDWGEGGAGGDDFAGGVSDGNLGLAAFVHRRGGVVARKAQFFSDRGFVALGAGISAQEGRVWTTVNQRLLAAGETVAAGGEAGVLHDGVAYTPLDGSALRVEERPLPDGASRLLLLGFDHGTPTDAAYAYSVTLDDADRPVVPAFLNTPACQAVLFDGADAGGRWTLQAALHEPGTFDLPGGTRVTTDAPVLLMLRAAAAAEPGAAAASVASPFADRRDLPAVRLTVEHAPGSPFPPGTFELAVDLPGGFFAGDTARARYGRAGSADRGPEEP